MSARLGTPSEALRATAAVTAVTNPTGNAAILALTVGAQQWSLLVSLAFVYTASATVGNRTISVLVKDAANNVLWQTTPATALVATTTLNGFIGGAVPLSNNAGPPITFYSPIPFEFPIPPGAIVEVIDTAHIDTADTCSISAVLVQ